MIKFFKIIEKIVYGIAALAIVLVVIMMVYGIITNTQQGWQKVIPYLYLAAFLFAMYKAVVIIFTSFYKIQITKRQEYLDAIKGIGGEGGNAILNQKEDQNKDLEAILDAVKQTPQADTDSIVSTLRERLSCAGFGHPASRTGEETPRAREREAIERNQCDEYRCLWCY